MKRLLFLLAGLAVLPLGLRAAPLRVALLDFDDNTGSKPDARLGGAIDTGRMAAKGADLLSVQLLKRQEFVLIDRRDFIARLVSAPVRDDQLPGPRPGFIQAAQLVGADAVLGGGLTSFSTRKEKLNQEGFSAELTRLDLRVTVRALDVIDGSLIAVTEGTASQTFRQTPSMQTEMGEEDILQMMESALSNAVPPMAKALQARQAAERRPRVKLNVDSTDNPAMVEIDGVLVGTTPLVGIEAYQGDHTLSVTRPGYVPMAKRIVLDRGLAISVPMFRTDLSAQERVSILEKADMKAYLFDGKPDVLIQELEP